MNNPNNITDKELDKIFKEASEDSNPNVTDNQWDTMRSLLERESLEPSLWARYRNITLGLILFITFFVGYNIFNTSNKKTITSTTKPESIPNLEANSTIESNNNSNETNTNSEKKTIEKNLGTTFAKEAISKSPSNLQANANKVANANSVDVNLTSKNNKQLFQSNLDTDKKISKVTLGDNAGNVLERNNQIVNTKERNNTKFEKTEEQYTNSTENSISRTPQAILAPSASSIENIKKDNSKGQATTISKISESNSIHKSTEDYNTNQNLQSSVMNDSNKPLLDSLSFSSSAKSNAKVSMPVDPLNSFLGPLVINKSYKLDSVLNPYIEPRKIIDPVPSFLKKGFYLTLGYAPEVSYVSEIDYETPLGNNQALFLNYRFSKKISINAGYIQSTKNYSAYPADYKWVWKSVNTPLTEIGGICRMIDIPINIRYEIATRSKYSFFGSTGITSYQMKKETYNYFYENNADPSIKWRQWNGKTGFYGASALNLSSGIEFKLLNRLNFQIEPFAKVPLKKIGFGKVKLSTLGVLFALNYPLSISNQK